MNLHDLQDRLVAIVPDVRPYRGPVDDLAAFRVASAVFVPSFMDALMRVVLDADGDGTARQRLTALAGLLEEAFIDGDDVADALAMRLVHSRLCAQPVALKGAWPYLGECSRQVAGKFLRLAAECDRREAAVRAGHSQPEPVHRG